MLDNAKRSLTMSTKHIPTERESAFLDTVEDIRDERKSSTVSRSSMKGP